MFNEDPLPFLVKSWALEGERKSTYWYMSAVLYSLFSILPSFYFLSFFLPFLSQCLLILLRFSPRGYCYNILCFFCDPHLDSPAMHNKAPFYSARRDRILPFQPLTTFFWPGCPCRPLTGLSIAQPPPLTCAGRDTRQRMLFCLFTCRATVWVLSLSLPIPHGMHLVVATHPCFLWVVCYLSRTFPPKEPE